MQTPSNNQPTIPAHVTEQLENEWRQVRPERETPRPATPQAPQR